MGEWNALTVTSRVVRMKRYPCVVFLDSGVATDWAVRMQDLKKRQRVGGSTIARAYRRLTWGAPLQPKRSGWMLG